jgi:hypothetical protein
LFTGETFPKLQVLGKQPWIYGKKADVRPLFQEHFTKQTGLCEMTNRVIEQV